MRKWAIRPSIRVVVMSEQQKLAIPFGWYFVGYSDELAAREIKNIRYFDREMVLFRTDTEQVCLTGAYCPHLGANLGVGGRIVDNAIQCPFHGWRFDTRRTGRAPGRGDPVRP